MKSIGYKMVEAILILVTLTCGGCKKNNMVLAGKIKSTQYTILLNGSQYTYTYNYTYNSQGRPTFTQIYNYMDQPDGKITYNYNGNTLLVNYFDSSSLNILQSDTFLLNAQGYVGSTIGGYTTYEYDNNGYLVSEAVSGTFYTFGYDNGNMVGVSGDEFIYDNKPESRDYSFVYANSGQTYITDYALSTLFGKSNTNLPVMQIQSSAYGYYNVMDTTVYSYQFDSKGRVNEAMVESTTGSIYQTTTYTYE